MPLSLRIEQFIRVRGPVTLSIGAIFGGFGLCFVSILVAGIGWLPSVTVANVSKDLGFITSLNWSITFVFLFPLFVIVFAQKTKQSALIIKSFADSRVITGPNGEKVDADAVEATWTRTLANVSIAFWFAAVGSLFEIADWWNSCGHALMYGTLQSEPKDWSTAALFVSDVARFRWAAFGFSLVAYLWLALALFTYLSAMIYALTFAVFLHDTSTQSGNFRISFRGEVLFEGLSSFFDYVYAAAFLGLCAAFLMRVETAYLQSPVGNMYDFLFQDLSVTGLKIAFGLVPLESVHALESSNNTNLTSLALAGFSLLCLLGVTVALYALFRNAKSAGVPADLPPKVKREAEKATFAFVVRQPTSRILLIALMILSISLVRFGFLFLANLIYALAQRVLKRIRGTGGQRRFSPDSRDDDA